MKNERTFYRKFGLFFLKKGSYHDKKFAKKCLKKAMEKGDEKAYLLYHQYFSRKKKIIDDLSYNEIYEDYKQEKNRRKKHILKRYLVLGTKKQKKSLFRV